MERYYTLQQRLIQIFEHVEIVDTGYLTECWIYTGKLGTRDSYPVFSYSWNLSKKYRGHTFIYMVLCKEIPEGYVPDHLCYQRACINFNHMEVISNSENWHRGRDRFYANVTHCKNGHKLTPENRYASSTKRGACKICVIETVKINRNKRLAKNPDMYKEIYAINKAKLAEQNMWRNKAIEIINRGKKDGE